MTTMNFEYWRYELVRERQRQLIQEAEHQRLLRMVQPSSNRWLHWFQLLAFLRRGRLVTRRLQRFSPVSEAPWN